MDSRIWKRMLRARPIVGDNSRMLVRDGSLSFWFENWLDDGPLVVSSSPIPSPDARISDLFHNGARQIKTLLSFISAAQETNIRWLSLCTGMKDKLAWTHSGIGRLLNIICL